MGWGGQMRNIVWFGSGCGRGRFSFVLGRLKVFVLNSFQPVVPVSPIVLCRLFTNRARAANRSPPPHSACFACQCHLLALHSYVIWFSLAACTQHLLLGHTCSTLVDMIYWTCSPWQTWARDFVPNHPLHVQLTPYGLVLSDCSTWIELDVYVWHIFIS